MGSQWARTALELPLREERLISLRELAKFQGLGSSRNLRGSESYKSHRAPP